MELELRSFEEKQDLNDQRSLFELSFPETVGTAVCRLDHYQWKFKTYPGDVKSYQYVAYDSGQILGFYAAIPFHYRIQGKQYVAGMVCDVMTHPKSRGKGVFTKLGHYATGKMAEAGLDFTTGYPIRPEVIPGHLKVGWQQVFRLPMYIKLLRLNSFLPKPWRFLSVAGNPALRLLNLLPGLFKNKYVIEVKETTVFQDDKAEVTSFLQKWIEEQQIALEKTVHFLSWRTSAPEAQYKIVTVKAPDSNELVGMAVVRPTVLRGVEVLAILDVMILRKHYSAADALFDSLGSLAISLNKDALVCMTNKTWAKNYRFLRNLMIPSPAVFTLIIKKLSALVSMEVLKEEKNWHLFWIDSDDL
jgi:GNAT superfamily N-acetyltransferase